MLEVLVHFSVLPVNYVLTEIRIPEACAIKYVHDDELPRGWDSLQPSREAQEFGAHWIRESRSPLLSVPSIIVRTERNYLINPAHPDFAGIVFLPPQPFGFDPRLK